MMIDTIAASIVHNDYFRLILCKRKCLDALQASPQIIFRLVVISDDE